MPPSSRLSPVSEGCGLFCPQFCDTCLHPAAESEPRICWNLLEPTGTHCWPPPFLPAQPSQLPPTQTPRGLPGQLCETPPTPEPFEAAGTASLGPSSLNPGVCPRKSWGIQGLSPT